MSQLPKVKQHRLHNEGSTTLMLSGATLLVVAALDYWLLFERCPLAFYIILAVFVIVFAIIVNFFRCPMRIFTGETENVVVLPMVRSLSSKKWKKMNTSTTAVKW